MATSQKTGLWTIPTKVFRKNVQPTMPDKVQSGIVQHKRQLLHDEEKVIRYLIEQNEGVRQVASKMVNRNQYTGKGNEQSRKTPKDELYQVSSQLMNNVRNVHAIKKNIPEIDAAQDILVSSILSPHDMVSEELTWVAGGGLPAEMTSLMLDVVKSHFVDEFRINDNLAKYLGNALFDRGSHILAIFPESAIDDIINARTGSSLESIQPILEQYIDPNNGNFKGIGILGNGILKPKEPEVAKDNQRGKAALEHFYGRQLVPGINHINHQDIIPGLLRVVDNRDVVKATMLNRALAKRKIEEVNTVYSQESIYFNPAFNDEDNNVLPAETFYKDVKTTSYDHTAVVNDRDRTSRRSIGHPLVMDLPHESCIPVFTPGNTEDHLGYLVLLDQLGNPLTYSSEANHLSNMAGNFQQLQGSSTNVNGTTTVLTQTLDDLSRANGMGDCRMTEMTLPKLTEFYTELVERDLIARFNNGIYGENIQISRPQEVYNIMLARTLAGSLTQILYIPATLVEYIAFYYNPLGIGESLVTRTESLAAIRIATQFASAQSIVKNAIGRRLLTIHLDEDEEAEDEVIAKLVNRYIEANSMSTLFSTFDPTKIEQALFKSAIELKVEGGDGFEATSVDVEYKTGDRPEIDSQFLEDAKKNHLLALQIPPTLLDDVEQAQFSAEFVTKNVLFMKRNRQRAITFNKHMRSFVEKYVLHDGDLIQQLSGIIRRYSSILPEEVLDECKESKSTIPAIKLFLSELEVSIPVPDTESQETMKAAWDIAKQRIDEYIPILLNQDTINHMIGEESEPEKQKEIRQNIVELFKNFMYVDWIRRNNAFPEWDELISNGDEVNKELYNQIISPMDTISRAFSEIIDKMYTRANPDGGDGEGSSDTSSTDDSTTEATGEGEDFNTEDEPTTDDPEEPSDDETTEDDTENTDEPEEDKPDEGNNDDSSEGEADDPLAEADAAAAEATDDE